MENKKQNTGKENSGDYNSGNYNSGYYNSGDYNSGYRNSGYCNSGYRNSGYCNSGYCNSGDYNSGDYNSGWFNTNEPKMRMFNKDSEYTYSEFREKFGCNDIVLPICRWIKKDDMTDKEKEEVNGWETMGGYLKTLEYKEAWAVAWKEAREEQREWHKNLPNFSVEIFKEITGIDVEEKSEQTATEIVNKDEYIELAKTILEREGYKIIKD